MQQDTFERRVCVQVAAHVCLAVGCEDASPAVLETLADVMKHYVATVGVHARNIAENGCRADVTEIDVLTALKQVGPEAVQWPELERFAKQWKQPCPSKIPSLPVKRDKKRPLFASVLEGDGSAVRRPPHIPAFLPPLPPRHTYQTTAASGAKRRKDAGEARAARVAAKQDATRALSELAAATAGAEAKGPTHFEDEATAAAVAAAAGGYAE